MFEINGGTAAADTAHSSPGHEYVDRRPLPDNPILPMFVQMNTRFHGQDESWREASRWVKFQEDVEDCGKRWSKPFVPALQLAALLDLKTAITNGIVALDVPGTNVDQIVDEVAALDHGQCGLNSSQYEELKALLRHHVKLRMTLDIVGKVSSVASHSHHHHQHQGTPPPQPRTPGSSSATGKKSVFGFKGTSGISKQHSVDSITKDSNNATAVTSQDEEVADDKKEDASAAPPRNVSTLQKDVPTLNRTASGSAIEDATSREKLMKLKAHNLFSKKVPKNTEACSLLVGTAPFIHKPTVIFVRLRDAVILEDFCEISIYTRFLGVVLGPVGRDQKICAMGKALGTIMSDQIFPYIAYRAKNKDHIHSGLEKYTQEVTVLAPSAWDPTIRLDPPKSLPSLEKRLTALRTHNSPHEHSSGGDNNGHMLLPKIEVEGAEDEPDASDLLLGLSKKEGDGDSGKGEEETMKFEEEECLMRTGRLFGGLILDIKRKAPWYVSDFTDAIHIQTLASIIYIYLATITKAITFGGFLGDITDGLQGVLESFLGHALAGGLFCLFGGQPLTVLGCTGPVLIFEKILVDFCQAQGLDYMIFRLYIGLWASFFCIIIVAMDGSSIVRYFTRFTEESFAALIGIIFIYESLKKLLHLKQQYKVHEGYDPDHVTWYEEACHCTHPAVMTPEMLHNVSVAHPEVFQEVNNTLNGTISVHNIPWHHLAMSQCELFGGSLIGHACPYVPDVFFFSVILFFGTFALASMLKRFKFTRYFPAKVRSLISDFAVILAIMVFVAVDLAFKLDTPKLIVPSHFKPTRSDVRTWVVHFTHPSFYWYMYLLAAIPALLLTILLFMDQQITSVIVNRSEHKLRKGSGYHLDMLIVGCTIGVSSIIGLPWCVAATVLCLGHVDSLKMETETKAPGETPQFLGVREQRVTGTMVFLLTGLSVKLAPILKFIPMPVLYGILLYMGVASLRGMQFIDRVALLFMPPKYQPDHIYLRHVPLNKVHLFTVIQVFSLGALWVIKSTKASLVFPLMVLALVGFRKAMDYFPRVFSQKDLFWLDNLMPDRRKNNSVEKTVSKSNNETDDEDSDDEEERKIAELVQLQPRRKSSSALLTVPKGYRTGRRPSLTGNDWQPGETALRFERCPENWL